MSTGHTKRAVGNPLGLVRGEKFIATTGVAFVSTLILALGAMGWASARTAERETRLQIEASAAQFSSILASQSELRIQEQDISGLRRLMLDAGATGGIERCAVVIPGTGVIASMVVSEINTDSLGGYNGPADAGSERLLRVLDDGRAEVHEPLRAYKGTPMVLEVTMIANREFGTTGYLRMLPVTVGTVALLIALGIYRRFRSKLAGITAISESLHSFQGGERRVACLRVGDSLGVEAEGWNTILRDREDAENSAKDHEIRTAMYTHASEGIGLSDACDAFTQGVVVVDQAMQVVYTNGAGCTFLGIEKDTAPQSMLGLEGDAAALEEIIRSVLEGSGGERRVIEIGELSQIHEGGTILKVTVAQISEADDRRVVLMIQDITQQRLSDESRNSLMAQATHELRTPLTNIKLYVEEAIEAGPDDSAIRDTALNVINKESRRLERVISDMMSVSEIEAGSLSIRAGDLRVDQMVDDLIGDYQAQAREKSIDLVFDLPPKMPVLQGDRDRIGQALHNLIGNALKYTPEGGKVRVEFSFGEDDSMQVEIQDTGIGIDPQECAKIFEKFYRADDRRITDVTGSGLGLALAREIARLHGGDITVESEIDQGSTFTFSLPGTAGTMSKAA